MDVVRMDFLGTKPKIYVGTKRFEPDVNRTRNLLIWSQTRYHCATDPLMRWKWAYLYNLSSISCWAVNSLGYVHLILDNHKELGRDLYFTVRHFVDWVKYRTDAWNQTSYWFVLSQTKKTRKKIKQTYDDNSF